MDEKRPNMAAVHLLLTVFKKEKSDESLRKMKPTGNPACFWHAEKKVQTAERMITDTIMSTIYIKDIPDL